MSTVETVCLVLVITNILQALVIAILACSIPYLWYKLFRADKEISELDTNLSELMTWIGFPSGQAAESRNGRPSKRGKPTPYGRQSGPGVGKEGEEGNQYFS